MADGLFGGRDRSREPLRGELHGLTTQAEVDAFPTRREANRITVTGGDITDLSSLDVSAVGTLVIRNTGIGTLTLPKTFSVATKLEIAETNRWSPSETWRSGSSSATSISRTIRS